MVSYECGKIIRYEQPTAPTIKAPAPPRGRGIAKKTIKTDLIVGGVTSGTYPTRPPCRNQRPTPTGRPLLHPGFATPASELPSRPLNHRSSGPAPLCATPSSPGLRHSSIRTPEPTLESPLIRTSSTLCRRDYEAGGLAYTGLDQRRMNKLLHSALKTVEM
ncbi:hypothetical protein B296_00042555 [Ensete ventricosum]|uniref:Uncharacterized protein n=1 Tax=Ensete ventricosum TaxID=4639 RepID=A0A426XUV7_ENSVE|nr:hypothetical protein B296_00042555 [Ensete ventricosum]